MAHDPRVIEAVEAALFDKVGALFRGDTGKHFAAELAAAALDAAELARWRLVAECPDEWKDGRLCLVAVRRWKYAVPARWRSLGGMNFWVAEHNQCGIEDVTRVRELPAPPEGSES